ncbi:MAG: prepilin-type N-terminal cleavage/methylation domain-containing protein [Lachnospiraceae bacterium]|nr:prepilin-type N-terminal cleavage/methylation domain-containing protein [Lachnospiraceae bacterium]
MFNLKKKLKEKKGFTLAELLIVVAIIAVLVAVSIPIFTSQLEKSRDAVSVANMRSAYAMAQASALTETSDDANKVTYAAGATDGSFTVTVEEIVIKTQKANDWSGEAETLPFAVPDDPGTSSTQSMVFTYADGVLTTVAFA